jgi:hypothetical protein
MSLAWYLDDEPLTGGWKPEVLTCAGGVSACNEEKKEAMGWRPETIGGELQQRAGDRTRSAGRPARPLAPCPQVTACSDSAAIIGRALAWGACFHASKIQAG